MRMIVARVDIPRDKIIAKVRSFFMFFLFLFWYSFVIVGKRAWEIEFVKKEGSNISGITVPVRIPYSFNI